MPRYARIHAPGAVVHTIVRFVDREPRLARSADRAIVIDRLPHALARSDWSLHAYALMSNHIHLAFTAGERPAEPLLKSLLVSVAHRLNRAHGRFGPVVGDRATTLVMGSDRLGALVAYLHNNPVRADLAVSAIDSDRTSHRAWAGVADTPPWLAVDAGLAAVGFGPETSRRRAFDRFVRDRASQATEVDFDAPMLSDARVTAREATALPVELSSPHEDADGELSNEVRYGGHVPVTARWRGDAERIVATAARFLGRDVDHVRFRSHAPGAVMARRVALVAGVWLLRRRVNELAAALAITDSSASRLLRRGDEVLEIANRVAAAVRSSD